MHTQTSSKPRLLNAVLGDTTLIELYQAYELMPFNDFRVFAEGIVMAGGGQQPRKLEIIGSMYALTATKSQVLKKTQDFILAGMGLGV